MVEVDQRGGGAGSVVIGDATELTGNATMRVRDGALRETDGKQDGLANVG